VVTGTRAEYGLLYWLMKEIEICNDLDLQIIATGMHLSPEFGLTYKQIESDGFTISRRVECLLSADTPSSISKSMGLAMVGFADAYADLFPDLIVVLGDRFELLSAAAAATVARIPIAHLHGGETTEGVIDEAFRHSITKMAYLHFTATEEYRKRVVQLGEHPKRVFNFGAPGIENISRLPLLGREEFEESIDLHLNKRNLLVTFHPVTLENATASQQFGNLLEILAELDETTIIFTKANADTEGRIINEMIDDHVSRYPENTGGYTSLGQIRYLSALKYMDAVIGNSSSGLIEAPSFSIGTINIGDRQKGRIRAESVIDCDSTKQGIKQALQILYSKPFQEKLKTVRNPHGSGAVARKIVDIIRQHNFNNVLKKEFYNIA